MRVRALALCCAVAVLVTAAQAYTIDCNPEFTDCESEMKKLTEQDVEHIREVSNKAKTPTLFITPTTTKTTFTTTTKKPETTENVPETTVKTSTETSKYDVKARLLNLNVDELNNFASALHNTTETKIGDLSDVNLDEDDYEPIKPQAPTKEMQDKFFTNLQAPFHPFFNNNNNNNQEHVRFEEVECKENNLIYKQGEKIVRGCEEMCECSPSGYFECTPRCKHPYIRRGRRLNDPHCFESPVDECCSIIACATGGGHLPPNINMEEIQIPNMSKLPQCVYGNITYTIGASWNIGCQQKCTCEPNAIVLCVPRCKPLPPSDKCINVPDPSDDCCEIHVCDVSQDAHEELISEQNDEVTLEPRQQTQNTTRRHDISAMRDEDHKQMMQDLMEPSRTTTMGPLVLKDPIDSVDVLYNNSVQVNLQRPNTSSNAFHLLLSDDGGKTFKSIELVYDNLILNLEPGKEYILKTVETGTNYNFTVRHDETISHKTNITGNGCWSEGKFYNIGEEFHIGCTELCECMGNNEKECAALVCPNHVGLELVSKGCVRWAPTPPVTPPNCCPRTARCLSDGTCHFNGTAIPNWSEVPIALTGCERRCFCENGDLDCQDVCSPLPKLPPPTFRCPPTHRPAPVNISDDDCCQQWGCVAKGNGILTPNPVNHRPQQPAFLPTVQPEIHFPEDPEPEHDNEKDTDQDVPGGRIPAYFGDENKKLVVISLVADSPTSVKMLFGLPPVLVGLRGSVDLRYTDEPDIDISLWNSQVFAPADEVLTTPRLEFRLTGLKPSTVYKIRGKLFLHNLPVEPESEVHTIRTQDLPTVPPPPEEKRREIDSGLTVIDANDTTAHVSWRRFTEDELKFIDGIQVRFRPVGTPIYSMTELLHHSRSNAELQDLRPGVRYEASLVLIPPPNTLLELHDPGHVEFNTAPYIDPYNWTVTIEERSVGSRAAEITWHGVPVPAERWVRVYRAAHTCGGSRKEHDEFRLATRDVPPSLMLAGLLPESRCRIWLELFLSNGKIKTSNVLEINTRPLDSKEDVDNMVSSSSSVSAAGTPRGDYYGALVTVGVVAALGALTSLLLLLVVLRRHRPHSVSITPVPNAPRESSLPPYDNPAYKLELQQETMDL